MPRGSDGERQAEPTAGYDSNLAGDVEGSKSSPNAQGLTGPPKDSKKPSKVKQLWAKAGLDAQTLMMMLKGSIAPTIAIAFYQADDVSEIYQTIGYLVSIATILSMGIMPRGMFLQTMLLNIIGICVGSAVVLLSLYSATQARKHTTPPGTPPTGYNSSASAVLAVWLFFQTYLVNCLRATLPQFQFPVILYSIFAFVASTYGVMFPTMTVAISFVERLIEGFTTGFAIATGVSLFIFPVSSRKVVFKELSGYLNLLGGMLKTQAAYLQSLEHFDLQAAMQNRHEQASKHGKKDSSVDYSEHPLMATPESLKLRGLMEKMYGLHTKIPSDINFAKREVAIGKMESKDMNQVWKRMRSIMVPIASLNTVVDILQRRAEESGWQNEHPNSEEAKTRGLQVERLHDIMQVLHEPMQSMSDKINGAMKHALILLELEKPPKKQQDLESHAEMPTPGTPDFTAAFKKQLDDFFDSKKRSLSEWCQHHDIRLPENFFDPNYRPDKIDVESEHNREKNQRQLFFALYVEYLLWRAGHATLELVLFVEQRKAEGALTKTRLIVPGVKTLKKWLRATFAREDFTDEDQLTADLDQGANSALNLGESFSKRKDPEHLPPRNIWEKIGEYIRLIPRALRSDASAFGLRVSVATMTVAIICFLHDSQQWFIRNRLLWAMIMVPISMTRTAGQSTLNFALRILGTAIAMVASYVIWYIVDGHTAGVIVFLWLWIFLAYYVVLKMPKLVIAGIISIVTAILIIGYELQVKQIGKAASSASGQPTYPTYVLAPYRLAAVSGGLFVAYFWTIFPYPVSETTELRKDLGAALYLLANLYSVTHETVRSRCLQIDGDEDVKGTRAYHLEKARIQVFSKLVTLLTTLKQNSNFSKFQLRVGGRFPQEEYESLIECLRRILSYTTLIAYASKTFSSSASDSEWSRDFRKLLASTNSTSHKVTSLLSLLSSSILNTQPLPPYLEIPQHSRYVKMLESIDGDILSIRHIAEPEYSAFACINICAMSINDDMVKITKHIKTLVGEIDFTFHAVSTADERSDDSSINTLDEKKTHDS